MRVDIDTNQSELNCFWDILLVIIVKGEIIDSIDL